MELVKGNELISSENLDKYWSKIQAIIPEVLRTEGWKEIVKDLQIARQENIRELLAAAATAEDIRYINNLGIKIKMYEYAINLPDLYLQNADGYFKRSKRKENKE